MRRATNCARQYDWQALNKQYVVTESSTTLVGNTVLGSSTVSGIASTAGIDTTYGISGTGINQACFVSAVPSVVHAHTVATGHVDGDGTTFTLGKVRYSMPSDFDRKIDRTQWDKSKHWEALGPEHGAAVGMAAVGLHLDRPADSLPHASAATSRSGR
jgi:hypothetical protein